MSGLASGSPSVSAAKPVISSMPMAWPWSRRSAIPWPMSVGTGRRRTSPSAGDRPAKLRKAFASMITPENSSAQRSADYASKAKALVAKMTLEEKALLLSGDGWWNTHAIERLQIPSVCMTDGPHGLRKVEGGGLSTSVPATCFPTASALASSWDTDLIRQVGVALAEESQANDVQILLGPGVNMKRSSLGGQELRIPFGRSPSCR